MPILDINNPDVIKFLIESYDKTARLRMKWNNIYGEKLKHAATLQREEKGYYETDVLKANMAAGMPTITRDFISGKRNRRLPPIRDGVYIPTTVDMKEENPVVEVGLGDAKEDPRLARPKTDLSIDPIMRPVDNKQKRIIYKDIPNFGRLAYLKSRNKLSPESKFYFTQTTAWEYGWRLSDSYFGKTAPEYGRVWRLTHDLRGRSGPHPDPSHYSSADAGTVNKCAL